MAIAPRKLCRFRGASGHYVVFQLAEVAVPRALFAAILRRIDRLHGPPVPAT
jgi:hypothetical protein